MAGTPSKKRKRPRTRTHPSRGNPQKVHQEGDPRRVQKASLGDWIGGARLRTLPLAISPVLIGTGAAILVDGLFHWVLALLCLAVSVSLQIAVNFANDYSDGIRGTDEHRVGPARLTASGKASPRAVLIAAMVFFAVAAVAGLALVIRSQQWWLLLIGAVCIIAAWFYTGGKRPYGYYGLGELFVFVFFGLVATVGTTYVQVLTVPQEAWFGGVGAGLLACAVLLANNLRDIDQDRAAKKRTLTVLIGRRWTRILFTVFVLAPFVIAGFLALFYPIAWLAMLGLLAALPAILIVWTYRLPRELVVALTLTSLTSVAYGAFLLWAFVG
ncbi:1,4-dihydroxy-2-naphthoate polyprenyltransferase [Microbacterium sp. zg.B48]|uniref:1,4-dihydroxy-2-naphthoate polyprenyltransferase n=1 Tax=unclassified Microbacterium TaxID=2609290 RepID=UPI00214B582E|nr:MULTISPECIES: 1,4-dihydroxy-2-naphthoate polyprenyltransferase [unclassified Microbacterium]MCR2764589.1 1,4-dihydroxy-2-naphthoate polyprenyltransferase [Microbacterium sp. zg.B48]MCR2810821.1 1,4-dihydroxy-2-naphthoate polyprenyltransferase [Microbacterium sp. zg.B185]WIM19773.1 1,4-dihydroxy-2-naphthoate polyprenyltransferase [Microbacterium sp. zg-B185]